MAEPVRKLFFTILLVIFFLHFYQNVPNYSLFYYKDCFRITCQNYFIIYYREKSLFFVDPNQFYDLIKIFNIYSFDFSQTLYKMTIER